MALAVPPFLATNCWLDFLGATGSWRSWLPFNIYSLGGAIWILSLLTWPVTLFLVCGAWRNLQPAYLESDPAATGWALIRGLLVPLARTALAQAADKLIAKGRRIAAHLFEASEADVEFVDGVFTVAFQLRNNAKGVVFFFACAAI